MGEWRNWYTRTTQNRVPPGVWVRFPPRPPSFILIIILEYRVAFQFFDPSVWWRVRNPLAPKRTL